MKTIRYIIPITFFLLLLTCKAGAGTLVALTYVSETGDIKGTVKDENKMPIPGATIIVMGTGIGTASDEEGAFTIHQVNPGTYDVKCQAMQKETVSRTGVVIRPNETAYLDFTLHQLSTNEVTIEVYREPPVSLSICTITTIPTDLFKSLGTVSINDKITDVCSSCSETPDGQLVMRGARPGTVEYIIDGEKIFGNGDIPNLAVEQVSILSGGIPAEYGDLTGGVIIITTKDFISGMRASRIMKAAILENAE